MGTSQHLIQLVEFLQRQAKLADEVHEAQRAGDVSKLQALSTTNKELRPQLNEALSRLRAYAPASDEEREIMVLAGPLLKRIREADRTLTVWHANLELLRTKGIKLTGQAIVNAEFANEAPPFDVLKGAFEGVPAVVVSAGPSLDKNFHLLEGLDDRAVIITMNRCVKAFKKAGIKPHLVVVTEGSEHLLEHFSGVGTEVVENLMRRPSVHPDMREVPRRHTFIFRDGSKHEAGLMELLGKTTEALEGGTVAHACLQTAYHLGCNPIIVIGQDLAYSGDKAYSSSDVNSDQRLLVDEKGEVAAFVGSQPGQAAATENVSAAFALHKVPGWHGEPVPSDRKFIRWIGYFETLLETRLTDRTFINATEGGANIEGMTNMRFEDAIAAHVGDAQHDALDRIAELHAGYVPGRTKDEMGAELRKIARAMERLDQLAGQSKALVTRSDRSPKVVQRLKAKSAQMREVLESVEFLVSELAMAFKFQMRAPRDQWEKLEVEYASLQQVAQQLLPFCRAAVKNLPQ